MIDRRPFPERPIRQISMPDKISKLHRTWVMSRVKGRDTKPELIARSLLHNLGYRFMVNGPRNRELPGKPDIVLPKYRTVVFVHGCFWHRCPKCNLSLPKSNTEYWRSKFDRNLERDSRKESELINLGWYVHTIWECSIQKGVAEVLETLTDKTNRP